MSGPTFGPSHGGLRLVLPDGEPEDHSDPVAPLPAPPLVPVPTGADGWVVLEGGLQRRVGGRLIRDAVQEARLRLLERKRRATPSDGDPPEGMA